MVTGELVRRSTGEVVATAPLTVVEPSGVLVVSYARVETGEAVPALGRLVVSHARVLTEPSSPPPPPPPPDGVTRLGLFVTAAELDVWRSRAVHGPYKTQGDVSTNSPGDWDMIVSHKNTFLSSPPPLWGGPGSPNPATSGSNSPSRPRAAGFYSLVKEDKAVADAVMEWLHAQAVEADIESADPYTHPEQGYSAFRPSQYMAQLMQAYDYARIAGGGTSQQRARIESSFAEWPRMAEVAWSHGASIVWTNGGEGRWTFDVRLDNRSSENEKTHTEGWWTSTHNRRYNNRKTTSIVAMTYAGIMFGDQQTVDKMKQWVKEWLVLAVYGDRDYVEMHRNCTFSANSGHCINNLNTGAGSESGWHYSTRSFEDMMLVTDVLARTGDRELYDFSTRAGGHDSECRPGDPDKSLVEVARGLARRSRHAIVRYAWNDQFPGTHGDPDHIIDGRRPVNGSGWRSNREVAWAIGNKVWQDSEVEAAYRRDTSAGYPAYWSNPSPGDTDQTGRVGVPGWLFLFGGMEDVNVYPFHGG